jgi:hypothetical protein
MRSCALSRGQTRLQGEDSGYEREEALSYKQGGQSTTVNLLQDDEEADSFSRILVSIRCSEVFLPS